MSDDFVLTTQQYVRAGLRRMPTRDWLLQGPDYSRAVEYPLAARLLEARAGHTLLDVGAGRRAEFSQHAAQAGLRVTAIDLRDDIGAELPPGTGIEVVSADATQLPFADETFDRIAAISTIEHIPDGDDRAMAELARVLKPGGRLVVSVPFNPLRSGTISKRGDVYGRSGEKVFFEHLYDEQLLQDRIVGPTGLVVSHRVNLAEPGAKLSRWYYEPRSQPLHALRFRLPWGWVLALLAPRFLRPADIAEYDGDDWIGSPAMIALTKPVAVA